MTIDELRKELKGLGYKVKLTSMSWGRAATYTDLEGKEMPSIATKEVWDKWQTLNGYRLNNADRLKELGINEGITGLIIH